LVVARNDEEVIPDPAFIQKKKFIKKRRVEGIADEERRRSLP